jgi:hypothetical protein
MRRGPVGIVEVEQRGLRDQAGRAAMRHVGRIALELGRAALIRLGHERDSGPPQRHGGGKIQGQAVRHFLDGLPVGQDIGLGPPAAGEANAPQRKGRRHQFEELAAVDAVEPRRPFGKLALQVGLKAGRGRQLIEAAPVPRTGQLTDGGGGMVDRELHWRSALSREPRVVSSEPGAPSKVPAFLSRSIGI